MPDFVELCIVRDGKSVLNPRRVMVAMNSYASSFNLTRQQVLMLRAFQLVLFIGVTFINITDEMQLLFFL